MIGLVRMRLTAFTRSGMALAPLLAALVVIGLIYGGGRAQAGEAYGFSSVVLFPLLAWQTQILLNVEPDVQRRLAIVAAGGLRRELAAGLWAAAVPALGLVGLAMALPWFIGGISGPRHPGDPPLVAGLVAGAWALLLVVPPALLLGALASRAATGNAGRGVAVLAGGSVLGLVFGLKGSWLWWLAPPLLAAARSTVDGLAPARMALHTGHALLWTVAALALYASLRRRNSLA